MHEGDAREKEKGKKYDDRVLWLLNDAIVVGKPGKKGKKETGPVKCKFEREIPLRGAYVQDLPDNKSEKLVNGFKVTSGGIEAVFCTEQPGPKAFWINKINGVIKDLAENKSAMLQRSNTMTIVTRGMAAPAVSSPMGGSPSHSAGSIGSVGSALSQSQGAMGTSPQQPIPGRGPQAVQRSFSVGAGMGPPSPKQPSFNAAQRGQSFGPGQQMTGPGTPVTPRSSGSPQPGGALPPGWKEAYSADGRLYFYNTVTKKTSWQRPAAEAPLAAEWKEAQTADGKAYWYNTVTKETTWQRPG
jgi:hypothetical protein